MTSETDGAMTTQKETSSRPRPGVATIVDVEPVHCDEKDHDKDDRRSLDAPKLEHGCNVVDLGRGRSQPAM